MKTITKFLKCVVVETVRNTKTHEFDPGTKRILLRDEIDSVNLILPATEAEIFEETKTYQVKISEK